MIHSIFLTSARPIFRCRDRLWLIRASCAPVSHEWTRVVANGPGPSGRHYHTVTLVGSKLFIFGGKIGRTTLNDMWAFDLNTRTIAHYCSELFSPDSSAVKSQPFWESYEPTR